LTWASHRFVPNFPQPQLCQLLSTGGRQPALLDSQGGGGGGGGGVAVLRCCTDAARVGDESNKTRTIRLGMVTLHA
jgi:hypothetical protein